MEYVSNILLKQHLTTVVPKPEVLLFTRKKGLINETGRIQG